MPTPSQLTANSEETIALSDGTKISIPKSQTTFLSWKGAEPPDTYGKKQILDCGGQPAFAELLVLRLFEKEGWQGVWVDTYGGKYRVGLPGVVEPITLPPDQIAILDRIAKTAGTSKGSWDVFLWNDCKHLFVELKRKRKDAIRETQVRWLEASLKSGYTSSDFLIVEWDVAPMR